MRRFLLIASILFLGNIINGYSQQKAYTPMPAPPYYLDTLLVNNGILEIAEKVYDNGWIDFKQNINIDPTTVFEEYKKYFGFTTGNTMVLDTIQIDDYGLTHYYYHQEYQGIVLDDLGYIIHAKDGKAYSGNGRIVPKLNLSQKMQKISQTIPQAASSVVLRKFSANTEIVKSDIVITRIPNSDPADERAYHLAYKFDIHEVDSSTVEHKKTIYVNIEDDRILKERNNKQHYPIDITRENGSVNTLYNGVQTFKLVSYWELALTSWRRYYQLKYIDPQHSSPTLSNYVVNILGTPITGNGDDTHEETDNTWTSTDERQYATLLWAYENTWEYFASLFNNRSIRNGMGIMYGNQANTYYDGDRKLAFGLGISGVVKPMMSLDIVAHEYTHVITSRVRKLVPEGETAALIESFSDIFGAIVQRRVEGHNPSRIYMIGEDIYEPGATSNKRYVRSLATPKLWGEHLIDSWNTTYAEIGQPTTYGGEFWYFGLTDRGGEHVNNSIQNHWFYLLAEGGQGTNDLGTNYNVTGIGFDNAQRIFEQYYKNYTVPTLTFYDAYNSSLQAAKDIYGITSNEYLQVSNAWEAVGVGSMSPSISGPDVLIYSDVYTVNNPQNRQVTWLIEGSDYILSEKTNTSVRVTRSNINTSSSSRLIAVIQNLTEVRKIISSDPLAINISGPSQVCNNTTYTIGNIPQGATIYWQTSSNISIVSGQGSGSCTVTNNAGGSGWIKATVGNITLTKNLENGVGSAPIDFIVKTKNNNGNLVTVLDGTILTAGKEYYYIPWGNNLIDCSSLDPFALCPHYRWSKEYFSGSGFIIFFIKNDGTGVFTPNSGSYRIGVGYNDGCGWSAYTYRNFLVAPWSLASAYPNPASDILTIEIDAEAIAQAKAMEQTTTAAKQLKTDPTFDIRLYDGQGNILRHATTKGGSVQFSVAGLAGGVYYLHVYDGSGGTPEVQQVVVER